MESQRKTNPRSTGRTSNGPTGKPSANRRSTTPPAPTVFEVDEYGTLSQRGVPEPQTNADLYPELDPSDVGDVDDAVRTVERHPGLVAGVQRLIEDELEQVQALLDAQEREPDARLDALRSRVARLTDQRDDWRAWLREHAPGRVPMVRTLLGSWLEQPIDWLYGEIPMHAGAQGTALSFFERLPSDVIASLGVELVYGDHPGSSYFAAELKGGIDDANAAATERELGIRFVTAGARVEAEEEEEAEPGSEGDATPRTPTATVQFCLSPKASSRPPAPLGAFDPDQARFHPAFGLRPDVAWLLDPTPPQPLPPQELRHLHFPWLFQSAWRRIVENIREPAREFVSPDGCRHVHVLRSAVYTTRHDGSLSGRIWLVHQVLEPELADFEPASLTIDGVPWGWIWLERWRFAFEHELAWLVVQQGLITDLPQIQAYARWAFAVFRGRIRRGCDLRVMRRRIAQALQLDPLALRVARVLAMVRPRSTANMAQYNRAIAHLEAHRKLERDAPRLHFTYGLLCHSEHAPSGGEPLQHLRWRLRDCGLSSRVWRLLLRGGTAIWRPMLRFYEKGDPAAALDYLRLLDRLAWRRTPDREFMQVVLAQWGSSDRRRAAYEHLYDGEMRVLAKLVQGFERLDGAQRETMLEHLTCVLTWLGHEDSQGVRHAARIPAWATLVRRAQAFERDRQRVADLLPGPWPDLVLTRKDGGDDIFDVVLLRDAQALRDEGAAMRHCALSYGREAAAGTVAVVSVRERRGGRRVATVLWVKDKSGGAAAWSVREVVGFANGPVSARVREVVQALHLQDPSGEGTGS